MESSRVTEAASGAGVYRRDVTSSLQREVEGPREVDAIAVLQVLANHKMRILKITLSAALVALIVALLLPKMYTATTTVLPPQQNQSSSFAMLGQLGAIAGLGSVDLGLKNPDDLFVAMLHSRTIEDRLIDRFDLRGVYSVKQYQAARKKLADRSEIVAEREGLISISVSDRDPKRAADLANAYVDLLHELNGNLAITEAGQRRVFYQQQLDSERDALTQAEVALKKVEEKSGLIQPDAQGRAIVSAMADMRAQVAIHEVQLQAMRTYATESNPEVKRAQQELAGLRAQLAKLERNTGETGKRQPASTHSPVAWGGIGISPPVARRQIPRGSLRLSEQATRSLAHRRSQRCHPGASGRQGCHTGKEVQSAAYAHRIGHRDRRLPAVLYGRASNGDAETQAARS